MNKNDSCFREYPRFGENIIKNVCQGVEEIIPWGIQDWILFGLVMLVLSMLLVFLFLAIKKIILG